MKLLNRMFKIAVVAVVVAIFSALPVIPVVISPVSLYPSERHAHVSLFQLFAAQAIVGVRTESTWLTLPVASGVVAVSAVVARWAMRRAGNGAFRASRAG